MAHGEVKHDYHLVNPSPWPLLSSLSVLVLALGGVNFMKGLFGMEKGTVWLLAVGFAMVGWVMIGWWREVIKEGKHGDHTPVVTIGLRYGMILFIASEVMFFVGWFWSFFEFAIYHSARVGENWDAANPLFAEALAKFGDWPPVGVETFDPFHLPLINTLILLCSGCAATWAHHALVHENNRTDMKRGLALAIALGVLFTFFQAYEYSHAAFGFSGNIYGASFFMATGFHGAHVIIGTIFLFVCLMRTLKGHFTPEQHVGFEAAAWYWHFVDVVWLFLFAAVYVWGG